MSRYQVQNSMTKFNLPQLLLLLSGGGTEAVFAGLQNFIYEEPDMIRVNDDSPK